MACKGGLGHRYAFRSLFPDAIMYILGSSCKWCVFMPLVFFFTCELIIARECYFSLVLRFSHKEQDHFTSTFTLLFEFLSHILTFLRVFFFNFSTGLSFSVAVGNCLFSMV